MKLTITLAWMSGLCGLIATGAQGNTLIHDTNKLSAGLVLQDTDYELDNSNSGNLNVENKMLFVGYKGQLDSKLSLGGAGGLIIDGDATVDNGGSSIGDGKGFRLSGDLQYKFKELARNTILGTVAFNYDRTSFSRSNVDLDFNTLDIKIGALFQHNVEQFSLFGGLEFNLYSDGTAEIKLPRGGVTVTDEFDTERDDAFNIRLGAAYNIDKNINLRADLLVIGEQTIFLGADLAL